MSVLLSSGGEKVLLTHGAAECNKLLNQNVLNILFAANNPGRDLSGGVTHLLAAMLEVSEQYVNLLLSLTHRRHRRRYWL